MACSLLFIFLRLIYYLDIFSISIDVLLSSADKAIVYGNCVGVFCCVQALLGAGLQGDQIVLVKTPSFSSKVTVKSRVTDMNNN